MSILVFTENWEGKFKKISFELVSYASKLASGAGTSCKALSIGKVDDGELSKLAEYGADEIIHIESAEAFDEQVQAALIAEVAIEGGSRVVILANNNKGKALAPRMAVRLKASLATGVSKLPISLSPFVVYKKVYSGKAFAHVELKSGNKIITLAQNSFDIEPNPKATVVKKVSKAVEAAKTQVKDVQLQTGKILLTDADIVVSGGRGMKSPDNWAPLLELASLLGAATACSRPVSDEGWRPHEEHTGQTGKIIAPNLYFAIGISGATQHLAGVSSSKCIVAINQDKDAPIFEAARYGIIGDALKVLPKLVEAVKETKK